MPERGITPGFWSGRRVFLTGHTGFMGGWLALWLARLGARVHGFALSPPTEPNFFTAVGLGRKVESRIGDVRDLDRLGRAFGEARPEIVFHLAAQPLVRAAYADPVGTFATNVMGSVHLLEAMRGARDVAAAIIVTSDKVYDNVERACTYREDDRLGGREPYGGSKACAEIVARVYRESYFDGGRNGTAIATARAGNVIGGGDWAADRIVPDAVRAFARGQPLLIRHPEATRPWQHVLEPLRGLLMLAERLAAGRGDACTEWNFGPRPDDVRPVAWLADRLAELWGEGARWRAAPGRNPYEARLLAIDIEKARCELGWRPLWSLEQAASRTVAWYKAFLSGGDVAALSAAQIEAFTDDARARAA